MLDGVNDAINLWNLQNLDQHLSADRRQIGRPPDRVHRPTQQPAAGTIVERARQRPARALRVATALAKGYFYRLYYRARGIRFRAGSNFRVFGSLHVRGPGEVVFGNNVAVYGRPTPWTYRPEARIVVGDNVNLGPVEFGCVREIVIGSHSLVGKSNIMDTDFHSTRADRRSPDAPVRVAAVHIGTNVWIGQNVGILPGTRIGDNSVVSFGAVCAREYPPNAIIAGNPAKVAGKISGAEGETA